MSKQKNWDEEWHCPKCNKDVTGYPALTRRNAGYEENANICSKCGEYEAFVDMAEDITDPEQILHWEFSYHQMCCGNATQDGHDEFHNFLKERKKIGKKDPPLWKIEWMIFKKMFPDAISDVFMKKSKPKFDEIEAGWGYEGSDVPKSWRKSK
ncbi:hypothetical protein CL622_07650 [archaeon]|nr:hypothetical protein [archaeon]|tara:strand:- start:1011 stop:1469 length:459 start_codon:yes stop_codon:yes gene_type:complete